MKRFKILMAVFAIMFSSLSVFSSARSTTFSGYSIYSYNSGNPTIAANWNKVDPSTLLCDEGDGNPCRIQASANGSHPLQTEVDALRLNGGGPLMNSSAVSSSDGNVKLTIHE